MKKQIKIRKQIINPNYNEGEDFTYYYSVATFVTFICSIYIGFYEIVNSNTFYVSIFVLLSLYNIFYAIIKQEKNKNYIYVEEWEDVTRKKRKKL